MNSKPNLSNQIAFARDLRKNQTPVEVKMWEKLRNRKLRGIKFLRQHPILVNQYDGKNIFYIADFYCSEKKLVVEIDGLIHSLQIDHDKARDIIMNELRLSVLRITNDEAEKSVYEVLNKIKEYLK